MADAVALAELSGVETIDWALGHAAMHNRFADADLASIVAHRPGAIAGPAHQAGENHNQPGTSAWEGFGQ